MIIIPMAGLSQRFRNAGYKVPKYMLNLQGHSLFSHAVNSFRAYFSTENFLFIARAEADTEHFIRKELVNLGVVNQKIVIIDKPTLGQADTVRIGLDKAKIAPETAITIFNIDTFRPNFRYPSDAWIDYADGYLEVIESFDPAYSYVLPHNYSKAERRVAATAEKRVISNLACTGLYHFRRAADFLDAFEAEKTAENNSELYVAPLYNRLISQGKDIRYHLISNDDVTFCGIPNEYQALIENLGN